MSKSIQSRTVLVGLAGIAIAALVTSAVLKSKTHGALAIAGDVSWGTFLVSALAVISLGVTSLFAARRGRRRTG